MPEILFSTHELFDCIVDIIKHVLSVWNVQLLVISMLATWKLSSWAMSLEFLLHKMMQISVYGYVLVYVFWELGWRLIKSVYPTAGTRRFVIQQHDGNNFISGEVKQVSKFDPPTEVSQQLKSSLSLFLPVSAKHAQKMVWLCTTCLNAGGVVTLCRSGL